jgi:hypothetical protein
MAKQELSFQERVLALQTELKAPKNQYNSFGRYNYRSQEDILEAVKPLLKKYELSLTLTDEVKELSNGICYIEARALLHREGDLLEAKAQAGIDPNKKGMDISQTFGSSSSYARKYALNGLLLIDDTKDADSTNNHDKSTKPNFAQAKKPWLNEGTPEFAKALEWVKAGNSIDKIKEKYSVSKSVQEKLTN